MLVKVYSGAIIGIESITVTIEVNILAGAKFIIVGLPDIAVKESQQRVDSALRCIGYKIPGKRTIINMAPANIRKEGSFYDLAMAIGILAADGHLSPHSLESFVFMGELSLDGTLRPVKGVLPIAINAQKSGFKNLIVPMVNANEASLVSDINVFGCTNLKQVLDFLVGNINIKRTTYLEKPTSFISYNDFKDVKGQENVKRAMEIAACGGHNILLIGSPGSGKTMLAKCMPGILPPLTKEESLETTKIHSVAGNLNSLGHLITERPFRAPHHTISEVALIGGGVYPHPGEISLANNGVLFLDELPEFKRSTLEVLRQPLEERVITISRARFSVQYPANFMLIASMNPCPCGYYTHPTRECICPPGAISRYLSKISGPLLDRIDLHIEVIPVEIDKMTSNKEAESSSCIRQRVLLGRNIQLKRYKKAKGVYCNAQMTTNMLKKYCPLNKSCISLLKVAINKFGLSARAYTRIVKLSRTIADLSGSEQILDEHVAEAIGYRCLDRQTWGN